MTGRALLVGAIFALFSNGPDPQQAGLASRVVSQETPGRELVLGLPILDQAVLRLQLLRLAGAARVPVGFEGVVDEPLAPGIKLEVRDLQQVSASGKRFDQLLELVMASAPAPRRVTPISEYSLRWREEGGVVHVTGLSSRRTALDQVVPKFAAEQDTPAVIVRRIQAALGMSAKPNTSAAIASVGGSGPAESLSQKMRFSLEGASVRRILDTLVLELGDTSWAVEYSPRDPTFSRPSIVLQTFDGRQYYFAAGR